MKRILRYIIATVLIAYMLTCTGVKAAYKERGYRSVGGEALIPVYCLMVSGAIYNRKKIKESFACFVDCFAEESEEDE